MEKLKWILGVVGNFCAWTVFILGGLFIIITLLVPLWYILLGASVIAMIQIYKWKPSWFRPAILSFGIVLLISYFVLEFVPFGSIPSNQIVNGVTFNDISGEYYVGDGLGVNCNLQLTPDGRFFFLWSGCTGIYDRNKGLVTITQDTIVLHPKRSNPSGWFRGTPTTFIPVKWGDRIYLISEKNMVSFCAAVKNGMEPRKDSHGRFYMRREDWKKTCTGLPALGERWANCSSPQAVRD